MRTGNLAALAGIAAVLLLTAGCGKDSRPEKHKGERSHQAAHGGCLNAIGSCETGHAEVRVEGDLLRLWFVGGENDTDKAVRVPDKELTLSVRIGGEKEPRPIILKSKPNLLLEEKEGDCSYFEGQADWLKGVKDFEAAGAVNLKGKKQELKIDYPHGYDPDHATADGRHEP